MLVFSRRKNETVCIDGNFITIMVIGIQGDKVRLGIEAPRNISVHRGEVQAAIDAGNDTTKERKGE